MATSLSKGHYVRSFAILPAAGQSRRMGSPKLLLPWGATTLIRQVLRSWQASRVDQVIVVIHPDDESLATECQGAHVVRRAPAPAEMKDSIRYGLDAAAEQFSAGQQDVWLVAPADMPNLQPQAINALLDAYSSSSGKSREPARIYAASHMDRRGHPVLFPWILAKDVHALSDDEGLNVLTRRYPVVEVEVGDPAMFDDIDTPEDYAKRRPQP